jgi:uncharacterized membrane protein
MAPLITLLLATLGTRWFAGDWPTAIAVGLAAMFVVTGVAHFVGPLRRDMIAIVPPRLPAPGLLVTVTGVLELAGAAGLLVPATRIPAAACLFVLMLAMFPANVHAARMADPPKSMTTHLGARTAEQALFLAAAAAVVVGFGHIQ